MALDMMRAVFGKLCHEDSRC